MLVHRLVRKHYTRPEMIRLRNEWVEVDPREWKSRADMSIAVGLGTGNKDQQLMHLSNMFQMSGNLMPMGVVTPINMYNLMRQIYINAGFKNPDEFLSNPDKQVKQPPQPDPKMIEAQAKLQLEQQKAQAQLQQEQARSQNDVAIERDKIQAQIQLEQAKLEVERQKAVLEANTQIEIARMKAEIDARSRAAETHAQMVSDMTKANQEHEIALRGVVEKAQSAQGNESVTAVIEGMKQIMQSMSKPKTIIRDADGRVQGIN